MLTGERTSEPDAVPAQLADRLAAIARDPEFSYSADASGNRSVRAATTSAAVLLALAVIAGVGYFAAPREQRSVADPSASVRADFAATVSQLPLTSEAVAAALLVSPTHLRTDRVSVPADPTMTGRSLDASQIAAVLDKAAWAQTRVAHSGVERVLAPRDAHSTAAQVAVDFAPDRGSSVSVSTLGGNQLMQGLIPTPAASRLAGSAASLSNLRSGYRLTGADGGTLLGRKVTLIEAYPQSTGSAAARTPLGRWWIDDSTGLVIRQQVYDDAGRLTLSASYTELRTGGTDDESGSVQLSTERTLAAPSTTAAFTTSSAGQLSSHGWFCHAELAGMSLVTLRADDASTQPGVLHMVYTDGLSTVSVFERHGTLSDAPAGSPWDPTLGAYRRDAMLNTATWQSGDAVFTVATDGPTTLRDRVIAALPHHPPTEQSTMERIGAGWSRILDRVV